MSSLLAGEFGDILGDFEPTVIIANFDVRLDTLKACGSRIFLLTDQEIDICKQTAQIQACVIDNSISRRFINNFVR